jgi:hypothetical protein
MWPAFCVFVKRVVGRVVKRVGKTRPRVIEVAEATTEAKPRVIEVEVTEIERTPNVRVKWLGKRGILAFNTCRLLAEVWELEGHLHCNKLVLEDKVTGDHIYVEVKRRGCDTAFVRVVSWAKMFVLELEGENAAKFEAWLWDEVIE